MAGGLAVIYPHWETGAGDPVAWGYVAAGVAVAAVLWFLRGRVGRGPLAGVLFFAVTLSPVLGFVEYGYMQFSFVADRHQYLAGMGLMAVLVARRCAARSVCRRGGGGGVRRARRRRCWPSWRC